MKRVALLFVALGVLALVSALLVAASGIIPIKASSGHWALTDWFLQFGKTRSVATHALTIDLPALNNPRLISQGASHYEISCSPCHGSPARNNSATIRAMLPPPPRFPEKLSKWEANELFYIIKHGIKFTGMPPYPVQNRDDEIAALTAFMRELPRLTRDDYVRLVGSDLAAKAPSPELATCVQCHGVHGEGRETDAFPKLGGQKQTYLLNALRAYASGGRHSGTMQTAVSVFNDEQLMQMADYFSGVSQTATPVDTNSEAVARGLAIASHGIAAQGVPACAECHGSGAKSKNDAYPRLENQHRSYLVNQLELFKDGRRGGSHYAHLMHKPSTGLTPQQMRDVAAYYASLPMSQLKP